MFEYSTEVPNEDGDGTEKVTFTFKPISQVPVGVLRRNRRDPEAQMWDTFEWGMPADQLKLFDRLPATEIERILEEWQASEEDTKKPTPAKDKS